jgi:hypothetical protein
VHDSVDERGGRALDLTGSQSALHVAANTPEYGSAGPLPRAPRDVELELDGTPQQVVIFEAAGRPKSSELISQNLP